MAGEAIYQEKDIAACLLEHLVIILDDAIANLGLIPASSLSKHPFSLSQDLEKSRSQSWNKHIPEFTNQAWTEMSTSIMGMLPSSEHTMMIEPWSQEMCLEYIEMQCRCCFSTTPIIEVVRNLVSPLCVGFVDRNQLFCEVLMRTNSMEHALGKELALRLRCFCQRNLFGF
jgi:hypothetical protein